MSDVRSVEDLEKELALSREIHKIYDFFNEARCPVCGSKSLKVDVSVDEWREQGSGCVKCTSCNMFEYEKNIYGPEVYRWRHDGTSELSMLKVLKSKLENFLK